MPHILADTAAIVGGIAALAAIWIALGILKRAAHDETHLGEP